MTKFKTFLLLAISFVGFTTNAFAGEHPEAYFGIYGIQHQSTVAGYQQYVGQVVEYLPSSKSSNGSYEDKEYWLGAGGKYNTKYVITKISGNDKRMTFVLTEKGTKKKVKMIVNNQEEDDSWGFNTYCITNTYSIPLFLSEKFEGDKAKHIGKIYPSNPDSPVKLEVTDIVVQPVEWTVLNSNRSYPKVCYVLTDKKDGKKVYYDAANANDLNAIGTVFTNPKYACTYTVINVEREEHYYPYKVSKYYTVKKGDNIYQRRI